MNEFVGFRLFSLVVVIVCACVVIYSSADWLRVICLVFISVMTVNMAWTRADLQELQDEHKKRHGRTSF